jgi:hypothetical protein
MRGTRLWLMPALAALTCSTLAAGEAKAPMRVSVTVVRSCTISSDAPEVVVKCGQRAETVRVTGQVTTGEAQSPPTADRRAVTIEF